MTPNRRAVTEVIVEILEEARGGASVAELLQLTNMDSSILARYVEFLMDRDLLDFARQGAYKTTKGGLEFIDHYNQLVELLPSSDPEVRLKRAQR